MIQGFGNQSMMSSMSNMSVQKGPSPEEKFNEIDADGGGTISVDELETLTSDISSRVGETVSAEDMMSSYDSDKDGELSQSEMDSMGQAIMEQFGPPQDGGGSGNFQQAMSSYSSNMGSSDISGMLNQLGSKPVPPSFNQIDSDGDGVVSESELETLTAEMSEISGTDIDAKELMETYSEDGEGLDGSEMDSLMADLHETLGPPPPPQGGGQIETFGDMLSSYLTDADSETVAMIGEKITNFMISNPDSFSGLSVAA